MRFELDIGHATHPGSRAVNEDFAAVAGPPRAEASRGWVAAIADGVSTGGGGREAAQTSVLSVVSDFHGAPDTWDVSVVLDRLVTAQNAWLVDHNRRRQSAFQRDPAASRVAMTTLTSLVLRGEAWTVAHVGDTRAWLVRGGDCAQLTQDHAFEEAFQRSRLTRALGLDDTVRLDIDQGELRRGDVFVLTTDGVHGVVSRPQLQRLAATGDAATASRAIVDAAVKGGARDNATALVIRVVQIAAGRFEDALLPGRDLPLPRRLEPGDRLDGYTVAGLVADNGIHRLYRASAGTDGTEVVVKTLREAVADEADERAMLVHEAWIAGRVAEAVPRRGEAGFVRSRPTPDASAFYIVFDWHPGETLEQLRASGRRFEVADIVEATLGLARAIGRLHRLGIVHRDIKPGNLHLGDDGQWRILDLGTAVSGSDSVAVRQRPAGTPSYMNREQWGTDTAPPAAADEAADIYALGVTLYEWLTTKLPYGDVEPYQVGRFRRDPRPPSRLRPDVPIWLDHVVLKAVALERAARFDTAEEFVLALERGAARPLGAPRGTPLAVRDPTTLWKIGFGVSLLFNALLIYWLLFLPH